MKKILFLLLITFFTISCTKYEDGPLFTFRSKTKRLCKTWKYEAIIYTEQGITVTTNLPKTEMTFEKEGSYKENTGFSGEWKFKGDVSLEIIKSKNGDSTQTIIWEITRLSNNELWLRIDNVNHHFIVNK